MVGRKGFVLVVVTNQPHVGRETQSVDAVEEMHRKMLAALPHIDRVEVWWHAGSEWTAPAVVESPAPACSCARDPGAISILDALRLCYYC